MPFCCNEKQKSWEKKRYWKHWKKTAGSGGSGGEVEVLLIQLSSMAPAPLPLPKRSTVSDLAATATAMAAPMQFFSSFFRIFPLFPFLSLSLSLVPSHRTWASYGQLNTHTPTTNDQRPLPKKAAPQLRKKQQQQKKKKERSKDCTGESRAALQHSLTHSLTHCLQLQLQLQKSLLSHTFCSSNSICKEHLCKSVEPPPSPPLSVQPADNKTPITTAHSGGAPANKSVKGTQSLCVCVCVCV